VGIIGRMSACVVLLPCLLAAGAAAAADAQLPPPAPAPVPAYRLITSVEGFGQTGHFDTGIAATNNTFGLRGFGVSVGGQLGEHLMLALRGQEAWTKVGLTLAPQDISVRSQSVGARALVEFAPFAWDTTVSYAFDDNQTIYMPLIGTAQWKGTEWAIDTVLRARLPVAVFEVEPLLGARINSLHDFGYATSGFFQVVLPEQTRSTNTYRAALKIGVPIHLDQYGTFTPWIGGEESRTTNPHGPLGYLTELTGMAGGHYVFNTSDQEGPVPFPAQTWRTVRAGFHFDVMPQFTVDAEAVHAINDLGSWTAYRMQAVIRF
jgi:hypothetical protein